MAFFRFNKLAIIYFLRAIIMKRYICRIEKDISFVIKMDMNNII